MTQLLHDLTVFLWGYIFDHPNWKETRGYFMGVLSATRHPSTNRHYYRLQWPRIVISNDPDLEDEFAMYGGLQWRGSGR